MKYSVGDKVIIRKNTVFEVAMITKVLKRGQVTLYNLITEQGSVFTKISMDNQKYLIFIDSKRTDKFINKIDSNLSIEKIKSYGKDVGRNASTDSIRDSFSDN